VTGAGTEATAAIAARFGASVISADGAVNRDALGAIVFADEAARRDLETIVHPAVYRGIEAAMRGFAKIGGARLAVAEIPLLYETGHSGDFDKVIVTVCADEVQLKRLMARGLSETRARQIVAAQKPTVEKASRADFIIRTDGEKPGTDEQVRQVLSALG
jgi:dephospho-CoA kinase